MTGAAEDQLWPGVVELEHTADVGIEATAGSLEQLFDRAAAGMMSLVRRDEEGQALRPDVPEVLGPRPAQPDQRRIELEIETDDVAGLLARWLRELLYLQEVEGFVYRHAEFDRLDESGLRATAHSQSNPAPQVRELKGVTYHGLEVRRDGERWRARVIFDI